MPKELMDFKPAPEAPRRMPMDRAKAENIRDTFQQFLGGITEILEKRPPDRWLPAVYGYLLRAEKQLDTFDPSIRAYLADHLEDIFELLQEQSLSKEEQAEAQHTGESHAQAAQDVIHKMEHLLKPDTSVERQFTPHRASMAEILADKAHFQLGDVWRPDGTRLSALKVRAAEGEPWHALPLPPSDQIMHKGGTPRVILKILAGASVESIRTELPPNDFDVVASGDQAVALEQALQMGVDIEGVEHVPSLENTNKLFAGRDIDLNQCFLGKDGLVYSQQALESAKSGVITLQAEDRGLYGNEKVYFDGVELAKNRGVQRLIKFVAEGKAESFPFTPLNEQLDFGIYWLALARKFAKKKNAGQLLDRQFYLGKKIGQTHEGEDDIYAVLDRVHAEYPFFKMEDVNMDQQSLAKWLGGKMSKLAERQFRKERGISLGLELTRKPGDTVPYEVSLKDYVPNRERTDLAQDGWEMFLERSRVRTAAYQGSVVAADKEKLRLRDEAKTSRTRAA